MSNAPTKLDTPRASAETVAGMATSGFVLEALVQEMEEATARAWDAWQLDVEARLLLPIRDGAAAAARSHKELLAQASSGDDSASLDVAMAYRASVVEEVLCPIREQLTRLPLGEVMEGSLRLLSALAPLAEHAVAACTLPHPLSLYAPTPGQPRRLARSIVRRWLRLKGRLRALLGQPARVPIRSVPVHALLNYHVQVRVAGTVARLHDRYERHVAGLTALLESGLTKWTNATLAFEHDLERHSKRAQPFSMIIRDGPLIAQGAPNPSMSKALRAISHALQGVLMDVAAQAALSDADAAALQQEAESLRNDFRRAGTILLTPADRKLPGRLPARRIRMEIGHWTAWHAQTQNRLDIDARIAQLRAALLAQRQNLLQLVAAVALGPVVETFETAAALLDTASRSVGEAKATELPSILRGLAASTLDRVRHALGELPGLLTADETLSRPGHIQWTALSNHVEAWPAEVVLHALPRPEAILVPGADPERRDLRRDILQILAPFPDRLAECARPLRQKLVSVWGDTEQVLSVVEFSLGAALQELQGNSTQNSTDNARELARGGILRAGNSLRDLLQSLEPPWQEFADGVYSLFFRDWSDIHRGVRSEAFIEDHWLGLQFRLRRRLPVLGRRVRDQTHRLRDAAGQLIRRGHRRAAVLIEHGRSAIGTAAATERDRLNTIEAIGPASLRALGERLPLVYRKLFALVPVGESWLLEGRESDLQFLRQHVERWHRRRAAGAVVLPMPLGSGRTSLLQVLASELRAAGRVSTVALSHRLTDSAAIARQIADAMGLKASSLEVLEGRLLQAEPQVCLIDNLEHLLYRAYGGTRLIEQVLVLLSRTDTRICWIASVSALAWQYLERAQGSATKLVSTYHPAAISRTTLGSIIFNRHQRSGMHLTFARPVTVSPLLYRRLERTRGDVARQALLRDHFFERLYLHSGSNVMLALLYWLRSAEFGEGRVTVHPGAPLSFRFLESYDLTRSFTLKAFLVHNTLTLEEHDRIFRMTGDASMTVLESLLNQDLIIPCNVSMDRLDEAPNRITSGTRYRLHPLVLHPVEQLLRKQNIIH